MPTSRPLSVQLRNEVLKTTPHMSGGGFVDIEKMKSLIKAGADVNSMYVSETVKETTSMLGHAILARDKEVIQFLVDNGADLSVSTHFGPALSTAIGREDLGIIEILVKAGADVNGRTRVDETTALMDCAKKGYTDVARYLLENGADTTLTDSYGDTALALAISYKSDEIVTLLQARHDALALETKKANKAKVIEAIGQTSPRPLQRPVLLRRKTPGL